MEIFHKSGLQEKINFEVYYFEFSFSSYWFEFEIPEQV